MAARYHYVTIDVFTERPFGGNQLQHEILRGAEMGRPSMLTVTVEKQGGSIERVRVGGRCVPLMEGTLTV